MKKDFSYRRGRCIDYLDGAITCLDRNNQDELTMIKDLEALKNVIQNIII